MYTVYRDCDLEGELCEKASKTWAGICGKTNHCSDQCKSWENAAHEACHTRGGKHIYSCYFKCSRTANLPQGKVKAEELDKDKTEAEKTLHFEDALPPHMIQAKVFVTIHRVNVYWALSYARLGR